MAPPVAPSEHAGASGVCVASLGRGGLPWGIDGMGGVHSGHIFSPPNFISHAKRAPARCWLRLEQARG